MKNVAILFASIWLPAACFSAEPELIGNDLWIDPPVVNLFEGPPPMEIEADGWKWFYLDSPAVVGMPSSVRFTQDGGKTWLETKPELARTNREIVLVSCLSPEGEEFILLDPAMPASANMAPVSALPSATLTMWQRIFPPKGPVLPKVRRPLFEIVRDLTCCSLIELQRDLTMAGPKYPSSVCETQVWSGTIEASNHMRLYVRSDDGATVRVEGIDHVSKFSTPTAWSNIDDSFSFVANLPDGSNSVQVKYSNLDPSGQPDGITLWMICNVQADTPQIIGNHHIWWCGGSETFTYMLGTMAYNLSWSISSNLVLVSRNDELQSITVRPVRQSAASGGDCVLAQYRRSFGTVETNSFAITIHRPSGLSKLGSSVVRGNEYQKTQCFQLMDQFGQNWATDCYVTCTEFDNGTSSVGTINGFPTGLKIVNGWFPDTWSWKPPITETSFTRTRERKFSASPTENGVVFTKIIHYMTETLGRTEIYE